MLMMLGLAVDTGTAVAERPAADAQYLVSLWTLAMP